MKLSFGKYKGTEIADVPPTYLRWLAKNVELYGKLRIEVEKALGIPQVVDPPGMSAEDRIAKMMEDAWADWRARKTALGGVTEGDQFQSNDLENRRAHEP